MESRLRNFVVQLYDAGALKFGSFTTPSFKSFPYYVDLCEFFCTTRMHMLVADLLYELIISEKIDSQIVCGLPYSALPLAALMACKLDQNMVIRRKEAKNYGTKKLIEGLSNGVAGQKCLLIDDVISTGTSLVKAVVDLEASGLVVQDAVIVIDLEQRKIADIEKKDINVHALLTISQVVDILRKEEKIDEGVVTRVIDAFKVTEEFS